MAQYYTKNCSHSNKDIQTINDIPRLIYAPKKVDSERIRELYRSQLINSMDNERLYKLLDRMTCCSSFMELQTPSLNGELIIKKTKVTKASFCRQRFCPICAYRISRKNYLNLSRVLYLLSDCGFDFLFVTLTIPNISSIDLKDSLITLQKAWKRFYNNRSIQARFKGFYHSLEITYNSQELTYHPHIHLIVAVRPSYFKGTNYLSAEKIQEIWTRCNKELFDEYIKLHPDTNINSFIINVKRVKDLSNSCYEMSKYVCKGVDISIDTFLSLYDALYHTRTHSYVGCFKVAFKGLNLNENLEDSESDLTPNYEWITTHWNYNPEIKTYIMKTLETTMR